MFLFVVVSVVKGCLCDVGDHGGCVQCVVVVARARFFVSVFFCVCGFILCCVFVCKGCVIVQGVCVSVSAPSEQTSFGLQWKNLYDTH